MPAVQLTEDERQDLFALATEHGHSGLARAAALECPVRRGMAPPGPCPCHHPAPADTEEVTP